MSGKAAGKKEKRNAVAAAPAETEGAADAPEAKRPRGRPAKKEAEIPVSSEEDETALV